jgi:choline dehydrogenase-like flavoprotein
MAKILPRKDVVIMGLGWTGAILAQELTDAGLDVVAIERGPWRDTATDFNIGYMQDELRYAVRKDLFLSPVLEAMTMRNGVSQTALPMRDYGSFLPGYGVGGAGVHWNGYVWRFFPTDFQLKTHLTQRYGAKRVGELQLEDWGVSYDEIEHCFDQFEYLTGTSGKAGNLKGQKIDGGNVFEGQRSREYPTPPLKMPYVSVLFAEYGPASLSGAGGQSVPSLCESPGRGDGSMHLLRFLRAFRLRQLFQGHAADHDFARADEEEEFRGPHRVRSAEDQSSSRRQDCQERHLCGSRGPGV